MAMNGSALGTQIATALGVAADPVAVAAWQSIANAIVTHITTNAVVTVASVSGVTPGPGVSGPGAGTVS